MSLQLQILSWIAVSFRLHTRLRVVREPWWDDLFVFLASLVNLVSVIAFLGGKYPSIPAYSQTALTIPQA
jgi:hypothetical protein